VVTLYFWFVLFVSAIGPLYLAAVTSSHLASQFNDGKPEINDRINGGRAAITKLNSILWGREVTNKTKTHIYHVIVKSTITYAAKIGCLKTKTVAKLNSTEMDFFFFGDAQLEIPGRTKLGILLLNKK